MYFCEQCNYKTIYSSNFSTHKKSAKHIKLINQITISKLDNNYNCKFCDFITKHKTSYYRHLKICKNKWHDKINLYNELQMQIKIMEKEKELMEREKNLYQKLEKETSELLTNFMANVNILLNKEIDNTKIITQAMESITLNAFNYVNNNDSNIFLNNNYDYCS
jgi:hypothetical protein